MNELPAWTIHRYERVGSTQRVAADLIAAGAPHRTVVVARTQTAGYGRKGDPWQDDPGHSLLMTLILRPAHRETVVACPMAVALAVIRAIAATAELPADIKWPNDVRVRDRKVAGILGDATWQGADLAALRIGVGINLSGTRDDFAGRGLPTATSLEAEADRPISADDFLAAMLDALAPLDAALQRGDPGAVVTGWRDAVATRGRAVIVTFRDGRVLNGRATNATDSGDLLIRTDDGHDVRIQAAEVRSLRHQGSREPKGEG